MWFLGVIPGSQEISRASEAMLMRISDTPDEMNQNNFHTFAARTLRKSIYIKSKNLSGFNATQNSSQGHKHLDFFRKL